MHLKCMAAFYLETVFQKMNFRNENLADKTGGDSLPQSAFMLSYEKYEKRAENDDTNPALDFERIHNG